MLKLGGHDLTAVEISLCFFEYTVFTDYLFKQRWRAARKQTTGCVLSVYNPSSWGFVPQLSQFCSHSNTGDTVWLQSCRKDTVNPVLAARQSVTELISQSNTARSSTSAPATLTSGTAHLGSWLSHREWGFETLLACHRSA